MAGNSYLHTGGVLNRISGGGHIPKTVHYTSQILELLLAFHYDWENETILPGATETFQKISNMYGYFFVHITLHGFFSEF